MMTASGGSDPARASSGAPATVAVTVPEMTTHKSAATRRTLRDTSVERGGRLTPTTLGRLGHLGAAIYDVALLNGDSDKNQHHAEQIGPCRCLVEEQKSEHRGRDREK